MERHLCSRCVQGKGGLWDSGLRVSPAAIKGAELWLQPQ